MGYPTKPPPLEAWIFAAIVILAVVLVCCVVRNVSRGPSYGSLQPRAHQK